MSTDNFRGHIKHVGALAQRKTAKVKGRNLQNVKLCVVVKVVSMVFVQGYVLNGLKSIERKERLLILKSL